MPPPLQLTDFSIFSLPIDEDLRLLFEAIIARHGLLDEPVQKYREDMLAEIAAQQKFSTALFGSCFPSGEGVRILTKFDILYGALCHADAWQVVLAADEEETLRDVVNEINKEKMHTPGLPDNFKTLMICVLSQKITYDLVAQSCSDQCVPTLSARIQRAAEKKAQALLPFLTVKRAERSSIEMAPALAQHCLAFTSNDQDDIALHANYILYVLEKESMIKDCVFLCRLGVAYAIDYLYELFLRLVQLFSLHERLNAHQKINNLLACAIIFLFYEQLLEIEKIFGLEQALSYKMNICRIALACSRANYQQEDIDHSAPILQPTFNKLLDLADFESFCSNNPDEARYGAETHLFFSEQVEPRSTMHRAGLQ